MLCRIRARSQRCWVRPEHFCTDDRNAIAPLTALWAIYKTGDVTQKDPTPIYVLLYGVLAICVGLWVLGYRVIRTIGTNMSEVNPASGFTIEFGAAITALLASKMGLPISTTHCLVGDLHYSQTSGWKCRGGRLCEVWQWSSLATLRPCIPRLGRHCAGLWQVFTSSHFLLAAALSAAIMFGLKFTL